MTESKYCPKYYAGGKRDSNIVLNKIGRWQMVDRCPTSFFRSGQVIQLVVVTSNTGGQMSSNTAAPRFNAFYPSFWQNMSFIYALVGEKSLVQQVKEIQIMSQIVLRWQTDQILLQTSPGGSTKSKYCPKQYAEGKRDPNIVFNSTQRIDTLNIARKNLRVGVSLNLI